MCLLHKHKTLPVITHWLEISPPLAHFLSRYMLETVDIRLQFQSLYPASELQLQAWTNLPTRLNAEGTWYAIDIPYLKTTADGRHLFQRALRPTSPGHFELTYRASHKAAPDSFQWLGSYTDNVVLQIEPPATGATWTQRPNPVEILPSVYVGNFMAASQAAILGFDAVLNMAEELNPTFTVESNIAYHKLPCQDGARHPIPAAYLKEAIAWIEQQLTLGKQRILVHCRAGIGRSGSVGIAYCFYKQPHWSYPRVLEYVWHKKPDIYPHQKLQETLEQLFPRPCH